MITDRLHFTIIEVNTNRILATDLIVKNAEVRKNLSGASISSFDLDYGQQFGSAAGINFKTWGQWIIPEVTTDTYGKICMGAQLVNKVQPDPKTGDLHIEGLGFIGYPKGIPWLEDYNPIAVDPAEVIQRIWAHLESYVNANLGVDVQPSSTGTQMLPGFGFDGETLSFDFFAMFIRQTDFTDCGDEITQLARDLPLDLFEDVSWNSGRTAVTKTVRIAYPFGGLEQDNLAFRLGENVVNAELADDSEIDPVTDVIIRSWIPGRTYSSILSNNDMTRARRTIMEEAVNISNTERAAAYAHRKLTKRNVPTGFQKITIDPNHPNAPFGSYDVGDSIFVECPNYPWQGDIEQWHRIMYIDIKDQDPMVEIGLKVGAGVIVMLVGTTPAFVNNTNSITNNGATTIYLGPASDVSPSHYTATLAPGATITYTSFVDVWAVVSSGSAELQTFSDGAFNYDPIIYDENALTQPTVDLNLLPNGYFATNLGGWYHITGTWIRVADFGHENDGCVRIDCDDHGEEIQSAKIDVDPGEALTFSGWVRYEDVVQTGTPPYTFAVAINTHKDGGDVTRHVTLDGFEHDGTGPFTEMSGTYTVPGDGSVNEVSISLLVNTAVNDGIAFWDDIRLLKAT